MISVKTAKAFLRGELGLFFLLIYKTLPWVAAVYALLALLLNYLAGSFSPDWILRHLSNVPAGNTPKMEGWIFSPTNDSSEHQGNQLVVFVHGWMNREELFPMMTASIRKVYPHADILMPEYRSNTFSNARTEEMASMLEGKIDEANSAISGGYDEIVLVGYSMGALIVRKAYVYGCGHGEDRPAVESLTSARPWVDKVKRVVLIAAMNRGWSLDARPKEMPWWEFVALSVQRFCALSTGTARYLFSAERGAPFVSNLRLQWLYVHKERKAEGMPLPEVVQLLGTKDDLVSTEDSRDVKVSRDFCFIPVQGAGHDSIVRFDDKIDGAGRENAFLSALRNPLAALLKANPQPASEEDPKVTKMIFLMHGIRDMGDWTLSLRNFLISYDKKHEGHNPGATRISTSGYGYFPMLPFLLAWDRQKNVRWFMDEYTEVKALYPNLQEIDYVGHSNGTFILASALHRYKTLRVDRVALAGSVVPRDYQWDAMLREHRVGSVLNYVGSSDWVVAIFPAFFETLHLQFGLAFAGLDEIGSAGFNGFENTGQLEVHYVRGDHGCALNPKNYQAIADYIFTGSNTFDSGQYGVDTHSAWVELAWRICWLIWIALALLIFSLGVGFTRLFARVTPVHNRAIWTGVYIAVLYGLLYTF